MELFNITNYSININNLTIPEPEIITVRMIPLGSVIAHFFFYLGVHIFLGIMKKNREKNPPTTEEEKQKLKYINLMFKWWPAIYLLFIILTYM